MPFFITAITDIMAVGTLTAPEKTRTLPFRNSTNQQLLEDTVSKNHSEILPETQVTEVTSIPFKTNSPEMRLEIIIFNKCTKCYLR